MTRSRALLAERHQAALGRSTPRIILFRSSESFAGQPSLFVVEVDKDVA